MANETTTTTTTETPGSQSESSQTTTGTETTATTEAEGTTLLTSKDEPSKETKPTEGKDEKKPDEKKPAKGAPEKYEFKAPEGYEYDAKDLEQITSIFKKMGLPQEHAQELMNLYADKALAAIKDASEAGVKAYEALRADWQSQVKADKEIGGKLAEVKVSIGKALDSLGDPGLVKDFKAVMDLTGAGDNPAFIKVLNRLAEAVNEGEHVSGKGPSALGQTKTGTAERPTPAQAIYGPNGPRSDRGAPA